MQKQLTGEEVETLEELKTQYRAIPTTVEIARIITLVEHR